MYDLGDLKEENQRIRRLQSIVDETLKNLESADLPWEKARCLINLAREKSLELFPEKGEVFDLVYKPRLYRVLDEKMRLM